MKLHGIAYENVDHKSKAVSKKGTLPFLELNGEEIDATMHHVLTEKFSKDMSAILNLEIQFQSVNIIKELGKNDLEVLSIMLAVKELMFGDEPSMLNMVVYSHLAQLFRPPNW